MIQTKVNFQDTLKNPNENSFFIHPTTKEEIEDNIKLLNDHKTIGPHSIPTQILKQFKKNLSEPLNKGKVSCNKGKEFQAHIHDH